MGDLSLNFSAREFSCNHCGRRVGPSDALVAMLQRARTMKGSPLIIVDGYRCPVENRRVGGVRNSWHLVGRAADVVAGYATPDEWEAAGARGIGTRGAYVIHVDMRPGPRVRFVDRP